MRRRSVLVIAAAVASLAVGFGSAHADEPPAITLTPEESVDLHSSEAELTLANNVVTSWQIDIQVLIQEADESADADAPPVGVPVTITVGDESADNATDPDEPAQLVGVELPSPSGDEDGTLTITLAIDESPPTGSGELTLVATPEQGAQDLEPIVLRRAITTDPGDPVPAVSEATGRSWSGPEVSAAIALTEAGPCEAPGAATSGSTTTSAPGASSTTVTPQAPDPEAAPTSTTISELTLTDGDHTETATVTCATPEAGADPVLRVTADDVEQGDELTGTLTLGDDEVAITLSRSAGIWVAVIVMALGFFVAYVLRWLLDIRRPKQVLSSRLSAAHKAIKGGQANYEAALGAVPESSKDPCVSPRRALKGPERHHLDGTKVDCELKALRERLQAVKTGAGLTISEETANEMAAIAKAIDLASALAAKWPSLATNLRAIDGEVTGHESMLRTYAPGLLTTAQKHLCPPASAYYSSSQAESLLKETQALAGVFKLVPTIDELVRVAAADRPALPKNYADRLDEATARLNAIRATLRQATEAAPLVTADLAKEVEAVRVLLAGLPPITMVYDPTEAEQLAYLADADAGRRRLGAAPPNDGDRFADATVPVPASTPAVADWVELGRRSNLAINRIDAVLFIVAVGLSMWTGLTTYYFDKAWGTWLDAATLFLWAAGTTTVLSAIFDAAKRFGDRRFTSTGTTPAATTTAA